jgi:hypothetical protein
MVTRKAGAFAMVAVAAVVLAIAACDRPGTREYRLPPADSAAAAYGEAVEGRVSGNLLEVRVAMADEMLRGGRIWARSGPYFYLFSPPTRDLFEAYPDLAAIRVVTLTPRGAEVARAELLRGTLTEPRWREALFRSAVAQRDGTERPRALEELTFFGEDHTEFEYNPEYAGQ